MSCWGGILHAEWGKLPRVNAQLCSLLFQLFGRERTYSSSYDPHASSGFVPGSTLGSLMEYFCLSIATGSSTFPQCWNNTTIRKSETGTAQVSDGVGAEPEPQHLPCPWPSASYSAHPRDWAVERSQKSRAVFVPGTDHLPCAKQCLAGLTSPGPLLTVSRERRVQVRNYSDF